jgi:hypothetical protein
VGESGASRQDSKAFQDFWYFIFNFTHRLNTFILSRKISSFNDKGKLGAPSLVNIAYGLASVFVLDGNLEPSLTAFAGITSHKPVMGSR